MDEIIGLILWLVEIFPSVFPTHYRLVYDPRTEKIDWKYPRPEDDLDDVFTFVLYNAKFPFFKKVVVPALSRPYRGTKITWHPAGHDRFILVFSLNPPTVMSDKMQFGRNIYAALDDDTRTAAWPQRTGDENAVNEVPDV